MHIRRLAPEDAPLFQELRLAALQEAPTAFGSSYEKEREFPQSVIEGRLAPRPDRGAFGAFEEGKLLASSLWAGSTIASWNTKRSFGVCTLHQGRGARELVVHFYLKHWNSHAQCLAFGKSTSV
jgi:hypothetical protein